MPASGDEGSTSMTLTDELKDLAELRDKGILTPDEFASRKALLLDGSSVQGSEQPSPQEEGQSAGPLQVDEDVAQDEEELGLSSLKASGMAPSGAPAVPRTLPPDWSPPQLVGVAVGLAAGIVGFIGFFLDFFSVANTSLSALSSGWFDLVPIFIGIGTLALLVPRARMFSTLSLVGLGIAFGLRGIFAATLHAAGTSIPSFGVGFWMITVGSAVLALVGFALQVASPRRA